MSTARVYEVEQDKPEVMPPKDTVAALDYVFDWSTLGWLQSGESIVSFTVTATGAGLTVTSTSQSGGLITAWVSGGTDGARGRLRCEMVTDGNRTDGRSMIIPVVLK